MEDQPGTVLSDTAKTTMRIKYAKEFFVTEKGEVIKIAAIVTTNNAIKSMLEKDIRI